MKRHAQPPFTTTHVFQFKRFSIRQEKNAMKVGTDGVLLGAWVDVQGVQTALDIGTGTGLIALMLAQRSNAWVDGVEINAAAAEEAAYNAQASPWADRIRIIHQSIQNYARQTDRRYDLAVCNPPFFTGGVLSSYQDRAMVRHTVKLPHGELLHSARTLLAPGGRLAVILPYLEGLRFGELASTYGFFLCRRTRVRPKPTQPYHRLLLEFARDVRPLATSELSIQNDDGHGSEDYLRLTHSFYLDR